MTRVTITDVTRMSGTRVCVAGVSRGQPMRLDDPPPDEELIDQLDGLAPGDIVAVDWHPTPRPHRPHVEDGVWNSKTIKKIGHVTRVQWFEWLTANHFGSVQEAFGRMSAQGSGGNVGFAPGKGARSLATVRARDIEVYTDYRGKIRVNFTDDGGSYHMVALEDLNVRMHKASCRACSSRLDDYLSRDFNATNAFLRVGLSREVEFSPHPLTCWLQVNGVYRPDRPSAHFVLGARP